MNAHFWLAGALLAAATVAGAGALPFEPQVHDLDNGLRVILIPTSSHGLVTFMSVVRTGSRDEVEPGHTGFAHFFEHMMFRGTERYPGRRVRPHRDLDGRRRQRLHHRRLHLLPPDVRAPRTCPTVIELEADRFQNLSYAEREFQTEAGAVYGEYRKGRTSPLVVLVRGDLQNRRSTSHTYSTPRSASSRTWPRCRPCTSTRGPSSALLPARERGGHDRRRLRSGRDLGPGRAALRRLGAWLPRAARCRRSPRRRRRGASTSISYEGRTLPIVAVGWKGAALRPGRSGVGGRQPARGAGLRRDQRGLPPAGARGAARSSACARTSA